MPNDRQAIQVNPAEKRILDTVAREFTPQVEKLKKLIVELQSCRVTYQIKSKILSTIESEYTTVSSDFFKVVRKLETPDLLFEGLAGDDSNMIAYFKYIQMTKGSISEGVGYIEIIDRTLDRKLGTINNNRTLLVALAALIIPLWQIIWPIQIENTCYGSISIGDKITRKSCVAIIKIGTVINVNWDTSYNVK